MSNNNKTYRLKTNIGEDTRLNLNIDQEYDILEILSLKVKTENLYRLHSSSYGCIVGRVLANGGVGIPNAKISLFIKADEETLLDDVLAILYPYDNTQTKNTDGIRYNLLPDEQISECHQNVGTFPNKRLVLDDLHVIEVFDKYYKFTTTTNSAGDYMLFGVPVGNQTLHTDIDLSDIGFLSQKPIDMMYKGYNSTQFENAAQFKKDTNIDSLSQIIGQNTVVDVLPFWGDTDEGDIAITRNDIQINYKFEPTCIFIGSLVTDNKSNGFSKKCIPTPKMGRMDYLTTGAGTIEMIRKTPNGDVEEFSIMGNELIDGNGTWCYQIPMNLDYVMSDENGNLVPTDNPEKGIPTRTRVRFRISLNDFESDYANNHLVKMLVPNNPDKIEDIDYVFGTNTKDDEEGGKSFRDLMWNNVYTVKSYIPRIQKGNYQRTEKFSGIKNVNIYGDNNPIPYNNMRVNITFMFTLQCAIIKTLLFAINLINSFLVKVIGFLGGSDRHCIAIGDSLCPELEGWYYAPGCKNKGGKNEEIYLNNTLNYINNKYDDSKSTDKENSEDEKYCLTTSIDYLIKCVEINLAMENEVIQFDFYNDWINGLLYIPRWFVNIRKKRSYFFGLIRIKPKVQACLEDSFNQTRRLTQQCALEYDMNENGYYTSVISPDGCKSNNKYKCHKTKGRKQVKIFRNTKTPGGIIHNEVNMHGLDIYYPKAKEWLSENVKANLFATDIVLLGSIKSCNEQGIPDLLNQLPSSTFQMPPNLVQTNMDSDGALYGIDGVSKCTSTKVVDKGASKFNPTFDDYAKWSKTEEFYERKPDDFDEYAISEMSGIDWGYSGPQQGENEGIYTPGGHFLSISCLNPEVSIKSCVNLSRICEVGSIMSQRQDRYGYNPDLSAETVYHLIPNGLISGDEINDGSFKSVFATLNKDKLKVKNDEKGHKKYTFISVNPINFGGELKYRLNEKYQNKIEDKNDYVRTLENDNKDYIQFRLGANTIEEQRNKFLLKNRGLSFPMYENSFYFYFGIKNGSSAADRFFKDYYSSCPKFNEKTPNIDIYENEVKAEGEYIFKEICDSIDIVLKINNFSNFYTYTLIKDGIPGETKEENGTTIEEKGLIEGVYTIVVEDKYGGKVLTKRFVIENRVPSEVDIMFTEFINEPIINEYIDKDGNKKEKIENVNKCAYLTIKMPNDTNPLKYKGLIIIGGGYYYSNYSGATDSFKDLIGDYFKAPENVHDNNDGNKYYLWAVNTTYQVYFIYECGTEVIEGFNKPILKKLLVASEYCGFNQTMQPLTIGLLDEQLTLLGLQKKYENILVKNGDTMQFNVTQFSALTPIDEWVIKKSLMSSNSIFNYATIEDKMPITNGTNPYSPIIYQTKDEIKDDNIVIRRYENWSDSFLEQLTPTKPWVNKTIVSEGTIGNINYIEFYSDSETNPNEKFPIKKYAIDANDCIIGFIANNKESNSNE